jgi:hypothetical protein
MSIVSENLPSSAPSTPNPDSCLHADLLEQLKTQMPEALLAAVSGRLNAYAQELAYAKLKIQVLEERLRLQRIEKYGPSSEKLSSLQLELLEQEPGVSREEVVAESEREAPPPAWERKRRQHPGRQTLPADLPRVERVIACTPEQCVCGNCGADTRVIGFLQQRLEVSSLLPHLRCARTGQEREIRTDSLLAKVPPCRTNESLSVRVCDNKYLTSRGQFRDTSLPRRSLCFVWDPGSRDAPCRGWGWASPNYSG